MGCVTMGCVTMGYWGEVTETTAPSPAGATGIDTGNVATAFDRAAARYDLMVGLNPGYRRHLRSAAAALLDRLGPAPTDRPLRLLDLGCGSGVSTRALLREARRRALPVRVIGVDASPGMLAIARSKPWPDGVRFLTARAEQLAGSGMTEPVDGVLAAYLFRNVTDADATLAQVRELLRPGGALVALEYSVAQSRSARWTWTAVCHAVVNPLARLVSGNPNLYRYLWRSVLDFDPVTVFAGRLVRAGYTAVEHRTVDGWQRGILHLVRGSVPEPGRGPA